MLRLLFFSLATAAAAQPITEGAATLDSGSIEIEAALLFTETAVDDGLALTSFGPDVLARVGLGRGVDVGVGIPIFVTTSRVDVLDPVVLVKATIATTPTSTVALFAETTVPIGTTERGEVTPAGFAVVERRLGTVHIGAQVGAVWDRQSDRLEGVARGLATVPVLGPLRGYVEAVTESTPDGAAVLGHVGLSLAIGANGSVDLHAGAGLTDAAPGPFVGLGGAVVW